MKISNLVFNIKVFMYKLHGFTYNQGFNVFFYHTSHSAVSNSGHAVPGTEMNSGVHRVSFDLGERALENLCCRPSNLILRLHQIGQQTQTLGDAGVAKRPTHAWRLVTVTSEFKFFFFKT